MNEQAAQARWQRLHEAKPWHDGTFESWREKPDDEHPFHFSHGTNVWVAETDHGYGGEFLSDDESPLLEGGRPDGGATLGDGAEGAAQ